MKRTGRAGGQGPRAPGDGDRAPPPIEGTMAWMARRRWSSPCATSPTTYSTSSTQAASAVLDADESTSPSIISVLDVAAGHCHSIASGSILLSTTHGSTIDVPNARAFNSIN
jgi:hypothetical protein